MTGWLGCAMLCCVTPKETRKVAHFRSMGGPKFRSMKTTQDACDYAASFGDSEKTVPYPDEAKKGMSAEALAKAGMAKMSEKFKNSVMKYMSMSTR